MEAINFTTTDGISLTDLDLFVGGSRTVGQPNWCCSGQRNSSIMWPRRKNWVNWVCFNSHNRSCLQEYYSLVWSRTTEVIHRISNEAFF